MENKTSLNPEHYFMLFTNCLLVKGAHTSTIYDLQKQNRYPIPNDIAQFIYKADKKQISSIVNEFGEESLDVLKQFIQKEVAFTIPNPNPFPPLDLTWKSPYKVLTAVIEIGDHEAYNVLDCIKQLHNLGCMFLEIRILKSSTFNIEDISSWFSFINEAYIKSIEVYIPIELFTPPIEKIISREFRIGRTIVYNCEETKITQLPRASALIVYTKMADIKDAPEYIDQRNFPVNLPLFTEAQQHNIGLNRKICIDENGALKNYLTHQKAFGNIKNKSIETTINTKEFQKKWFISNDKIEKCKECQYRYACLSNSDIIEKKGAYYKKETCSFDPKTNTWEN